MRIAGWCGALWLIPLVLSASELKLPEGFKPGMERGEWSVENWGSPGTVEKTFVESQRALKLAWHSSDKEKAAFRHDTLCSLPERGKLWLNVYCPSDTPPKVALAIATTPELKYFESKTWQLKEGWNRIEVGISHKSWKCAASGWQNNVEVDSPDEIRAITLLVYHGDSDGALILTGVQHDQDERGQTIDRLIEQLRTGDQNAREQAEKELVQIGRPAVEGLSQVVEGERPEVLLRVASTLRAIDEAPAGQPQEAAVETERQKADRTFEEARRRVEGATRELDNSRLKLRADLKLCQDELAQGREALKNMEGMIDTERRKVFSQSLEKLEALTKELSGLAGKSEP